MEYTLYCNVNLKLLDLKFILFLNESAKSLSGKGIF